MTAQAGVEKSENEVNLRGRVSADPVSRELPSGDALVTFRVVVPRPDPQRPKDRRRAPTVDTIDCCVWAAGAQRHVLRWRAGDVVEVRGSLRRRFYAAGAIKASRVEVEMAAGRVIRRASA